MHCDEIGPLLLRRLEGRLGPDEEHGLERHLEQCETCRETLEVQRRVAAVLSSRPVVEVPMGFAGRVMVNLEPVPGWLDALNWRVWTFRLAPVAAALMVVAAMGVRADRGGRAAGVLGPGGRMGRRRGCGGVAGIQRALAGGGH